MMMIIIFIVHVDEVSSGKNQEKQKSHLAIHRMTTADHFVALNFCLVSLFHFYSISWNEK